jgi:hypothetical protein
MEQQLVRQQEASLQTNNWFDFLIFGLFTFSVILIGLPVSIYLFKKGLESFVKYKFARLPESFLIIPGFGNYSIEIFCYGLFMFSFSIWYLFFDKGGQLENFVKQAKHFF